MKNGSYESRKEQIESGFMRELSRDLKLMGFALSRQAKMRIKEELKSAAMVGAVEERSRSLDLVGRQSALAHAIASVPVMKVLGYE